MFQAVREFRIGRPQLFAGLLLLAFLVQCFWTAAGRRLSDLEYEYMASGYAVAPSHSQIHSPFTSIMAALPVRAVGSLKDIAPASIKSALGIPRRWVVRLPFVIFGVWLGGALWWVARRLFGNSGGYVALALYCFSPAMVMISSNIGPEIILAWSSFGLIYTAIGVAHTIYAPPRKWLPRIIILGTAIGICLSTAIWSVTVVLLAFAFMLYLAPGRRRAALAVLLAASTIGIAILWLTTWLAGASPLTRALITPQFTQELLANLGFIFADAYGLAAYPVVTTAMKILLIVFMAAALTTYGSWARARYFGNTAPLATAFAVVLLFALVPPIHFWFATLGLSFIFLFIGGIAADLLETPWRRAIALSLTAILALRSVLALSLLYGWIHQNLI